MPFGPWQLKSFIAGIIIAYFVIPRVMAFVSTAREK
jgi:hypothetical protein